MDVKTFPMSQDWSVLGLLHRQNVYLKLISSIKPWSDIVYNSTLWEPRVHTIPHTFRRNPPRKPQLHTKLSPAGLHLISSFVEASFVSYLLLSVEMLVLTVASTNFKSLFA